MAFDVGDLSGVMNMTCVNQNTGAVSEPDGHATGTPLPCSIASSSRTSTSLGNGACMWMDQHLERGHARLHGDDDEYDKRSNRHSALISNVMSGSFGAPPSIIESARIYFVGNAIRS